MSTSSGSCVVYAISAMCMAGISRRLADLAIKNRLPSMFSLREFVTVGGLMSYGPNRAELFRRAAVYVDISKHVGRVKSERVLV